MRGVNNSVETVNAAATAIVTAESRVQQVTSPRRRWGGWFSVYWCFGSQRHGKRINHAVVIPETTVQGSAPEAPENPNHPPAFTLPFVAPPSSPASFLQSEPPSATQSPVGLFSLSAHSANVYSPNGPASMFAIGPYAHETQLVSPPVFSTLTTEPSTAPFTPPPEPVHLTTPSSPEVPFALLISSLDSNLKKGEGYEFQSYQLYPGSPIGPLISPSSVCSGTSSPFPDQEVRSSIGSAFPSFLIGEPPKLLNAEGLASRKMIPIQSSRRVGLLVDDHSSAPLSVGDSGNNSRNGDSVTNPRVSFELSAEEVALCLAKEPAVSGEAVSESHIDSPKLAAGSSQQPTNDAENILGCCVDVTYHDLPDRLKLSTAERSAKEFKFDNADGTPSVPTVGSDWWANEKVIGTDISTSKNWAFFHIKQPGVS